MAVTTHSFKYKPTTAPSGTEDRVLACSHTTDDCHCVINASGQIGYYVSGVFTQIGTATISLNEQYSFIIEHDTSGNGCIYLNGQKIGCATNFPATAINQIGNFKTELKPETGRKPKVGLKPRTVSNIYTRPCCGVIDEYARFNRALSASEVVDLSQSGTLSKVYTLADYKIALMADDGIIATTEKPRYKENWRSIWDADQRTSALPTAIASITVNGSYKSLATSANDAGIWTPTTNGTPAYDYYQAVESWRKMYFVSSGGGTGFLLTANLAGDTDISAMSPTLESRQSALMFAEDALRSAVMIKRQSTAELTSVANANAYTDELEDALREQTDHAIVFTTNTSDPSTGWTAEEKLIHKGDYWRVDASSAWETWTGTTWGTVNDAQAQAAANLAQSVANGKTTLYGTLASAKLAAKSGDQFFYNSEIYVCTADLAATARRYTTKSYGNSATAPVQTTQTVSGCVLTEPLNFGDTYFNTTTKKFYTYTTSWVEDTATGNLVIAYAPKYLGRYYQSHPGAPNNGDWWLVYGLASSPVTRGFWYNNNGTNTLVSTLGTEAQRKYKGIGLEDVLYASNNGYALTSTGAYDPVAIYGVQAYEFIAAHEGFLRKLSSQQIQFEEFVASIAGNTLVPRSGSTPGTQQIYMGKNPRYPDDETRAYEFALQEYLGMDGDMEVWMKHFWTRVLASGVAALTLTGCIQANSGFLSRPGVAWKQYPDWFTTSPCSAMCASYNMIIIGSSDGKLAYSTDAGFTYKACTSPFGTAYITKIVYGNGRWIASTANGKLAYSTNGTTFTLCTHPFGANSISNLDYGNGLWLASAGNVLAQSTNGTAFTTKTNPAGYISEIAYKNARWFICSGESGAIYYSADNATTFATCTTPASDDYITGMAYGNGVYVATRYESVPLYSFNGVTFTTGFAPAGLNNMEGGIAGIVYGSGLFIIYAMGGGIASSADGITFGDAAFIQTLGIRAAIHYSKTNSFMLCCVTYGSPPIPAIFRSDPLEAGGGVVGKVNDKARGELNKLWDGRYFPSYASVDEIAPKKYFRFPVGTQRGVIFTALIPYFTVDLQHVSCIGSYSPSTWPGIIRRDSATSFSIFNTIGALIDSFVQNSTTTLTDALQLEFIIPQ